MTIRGALLAGLLSVWSEEGEASTIGRFSSSALPVRTKVNQEFTCQMDLVNSVNAMVTMDYL
jgi:hypothetical protein